MVETEQFIMRLRSQIRELQSLLNHLEDRETALPDDYTYVHAKLLATVRQLEELTQLSRRLGAGRLLRAHWLN